MRTGNLWTVDSNGKLIPFGHNALKQQPGDIIVDRERNATYQTYTERGRNRWLYLGPVTSKV